MERNQQFEPIDRAIRPSSIANCSAKPRLQKDGRNHHSISSIRPSLISSNASRPRLQKDGNNSKSTRCRSARLQRDGNSSLTSFGSSFNSSSEFDLSAEFSVGGRSNENEKKKDQLKNRKLVSKVRRGRRPQEGGANRTTAEGCRSRSSSFDSLGSLSHSDHETSSSVSEIRCNKNFPSPGGIEKSNEKERCNNNQTIYRPSKMEKHFQEGEANNQRRKIPPKVRKEPAQNNRGKMNDIPSRFPGAGVLTGVRRRRNSISRERGVVRGDNKHEPTSVAQQSTSIPELFDLGGQEFADKMERALDCFASDHTPSEVREVLVKIKQSLDKVSHKHLKPVTTAVRGSLSRSPLRRRPHSRSPLREHIHTSSRRRITTENKETNDATNRNNCGQVSPRSCSRDRSSNDSEKNNNGLFHEDQLKFIDGLYNKFDS